LESPKSEASEEATGQRARIRRRRRGRGLHVFLIAFAAVVKRLPLRAARAIGSFLGSVGNVVARRERRIALQNIARAFPDWSEARRRATIRAMFRHLGASLFEILWLPNLDLPMRDRTTVIEGAEPMLKVIDGGGGVIVFSGHCGNWEWLANSTGLFGRPLTVLQRERNEAELNRFITETRARAGIRTIDRGSTAAGRELIQSLRRGGILAFLLDQNIRTDSAKVPFFGIPSLTPIGPAKLAIRTGASIVTVFTERRPDGLQHIRFGEPFTVPRSEDPIVLTARITREIEAQIRRVPEQWVWFHERWRERPEWEVGADTPTPERAPAP
jgi:KDO2-lipid IV(A) lauroyltransferase